MRSVSVTAADKVRLAAVECGNPDGPEIVFIHGFSQAHLAWRRQFADAALTQQFRLIAYDLCGHGASDKPLQRARYSDDRAWADDLAAVIAAFNLRRPVLVAWSYAGRVVSDYLRAHGQERIAGINYVAAVTKSDSAHWGPALRATGGMTAEDLTENIAASRAFVRACFQTDPGAKEREITLAYTMLTPAAVRAAMLQRSRNPGDMLGTLRVPVLVTHGERDRLVLPSAGEFTAAAAPGARLSLYAGIGHSPFFEDAPRFNRELADFVRGAQSAEAAATSASCNRA